MEVLDMGVHDRGKRDKLNQFVNEEAKGFFKNFF